MILSRDEFIARLKNGESLASIAKWFLKTVDYPTLTTDAALRAWNDRNKLTPFETWFR